MQRTDRFYKKHNNNRIKIHAVIFLKGLTKVPRLQKAKIKGKTVLSTIEPQNIPGLTITQILIQHFLPITLINYRKL